MGYFAPRETGRPVKIKDEGVTLTNNVASLDAVGSGVTATATGDAVTMTIPGATGTVTSVAVATANGFSGTVANPTTSASITLATTVVGILVGNGTSVTAASTVGSGSVVLDTSPTLVTPILGAATATTLNRITITVPATGATFTLADGSTLATSGAFSTTLTATGATNVTLPTTGTLATLAGTEELDNKTLDSSVGKGTWTASGTWTLPAVTLGGNAQLSENVSIDLDAALSADGKYCGIAEDGTAGTTLAFGDLVYLQASDSRWELCDANSTTTAVPKIGMCVLAAAGDGSATKILLWGKIRADANFPTLTIGAAVYMAETAGDIVVTQPSTSDVIIRVVGYGNKADELFFCPSPDFITHI